MKRVLIMTVAIIMLTSIVVNLYPSNVDSEVITTLGNPGNPIEKTITLDGDIPPLLDATTYIDIPVENNNILPGSYFSISPVDTGDGKFGYNPTVDVGVDGDIEWTYDGTGYGHFGKQTVFSDDYKKKTLKYNSPGYNTETSVKVPLDARVVDARIDIEGRLSTPTFKGTSLTLDTGLDQAAYVDTGDIDGDGSIDVVVTSTNSGNTKPDLVWYKNPSPPGGTDWTKKVIATDIDMAYRVKVADLDSDGDLDILVSTSSVSGGIRWYENKDFGVKGSGNGSQWEGGDNAHRIDANANINYAYYIDIGDLDNDGDIDIAAAPYYWNDRSVYVFENQDPVNGTKWKRLTAFTTTTGWQIGDISIGNIDTKQPNRLDIVVTIMDWQGAVYFLDNDGTPFSGSWNSKLIRGTSGSLYEYYPSWVDIGDIDGDGDNDVAVAKRYSGTYYGIWWYKNPSDPINSSNQWNRYQVYQSSYYPTDLLLAKVNSDSDLDIITTSNYQWSSNYKIHYLENEGSGSSWTHTAIDTTLSGVTGVGAANLDSGSGDTDMDIIGTGFYASEIKWYKNNGAASPTFEALPVDDAGIAEPNDLEVIDVDGDGDNDFIVTGTRSGDIQWFEAPDNPYSKKWNKYNIDPGLGQAFQIATGDFDGDGDTDIAATGHQNYWWGSGDYGKVIWYEHPDSNIKGVSSWKKHVVDSQANSPYGIDVGDIDGDGDDDIVAVIEYANKVRLYQNKDGKGLTWDIFEIGSISTYPAGCKLADIDLDNDLDVVVTMGYDYSWGSTTGVLWLEQPSMPNTTNWPKHPIDKQLNSVKDVAIADVDDNGYPDVIVTTKRDNNQKGVYWYANPGKNGVDWTGYRISTRTLFGGSYLYVDDIGNDGYLDVIASSGWNDYTNFGTDQVIWFEEPDEPLQASYWESYTVMSNIDDPRGVFVADIDGAGLKDIVCLGSSVNEIWWHRVNMSYPRDVSLNVAGMGPVDFEYNGEVNVPKTSTNMALTFKEVLSDAGTTYETDLYGNKIAEIPFEVYSPVVGRVGIHSIDIVYQYDAKVEINPHNNYLFNELNEIIPENPESAISVNIGVTSQTPATMSIGNVMIQYNSPPVLEKDIPSDRHVMEGDSVNHLFNLHDYFSDDIDSPDQLIYRVEENSEADNVWVFVTDMRYIKVSAQKNDDWSGSMEIVVSATDSYGAKTLSNPFKITIDNTNDRPLVGEPIPDFEIYEGQTTMLVNMDSNDYFIDIDSEKLYYRAIVDENFRDYLRVDFDDENNMHATAIGDKHESNIPVSIYCDDKDLSGLTLDELETSEITQDIFIDIINVNDGPIWLNFPAQIQIEEDYVITHGKPYRWLNLNDFAYDEDNNEFELSYSVVRNSNASYFKVTIDSRDWLYIDNSLVENYVGKAYVTLRMTDGKKYSDISFWIKTIAINDKPTINIISPENYATVYGETSIYGSAQDIEGLEKVMARINDGEWFKITGTNSWEFKWDTSKLDDSDYLLSFRAYDNDMFDQKVSEVVQIRLVVRNVDNDPDNDGYYGDDDKFPSEPSQWSDTDRDGYGDNPLGYNADLFPEDPTEWFDFDRDGFGNNIDKFPYDPTQWNDTDGDGFGDNPVGNNPDVSVMDASAGSSVIDEKQDESDGGGATTVLWIIVVIIVIVNLLVTFFFNRYYKPPPQD